MVQQNIGTGWNANRTYALIIGILFLILAVFGWIFSPTNGTLFGIFAVGTTRNIVTSVTAILGLWAAYAGPSWSRLFNQVFGIVYLVIGILAFIPGFNTGGTLFDFMSVNTAENVLDLVLGAIGIYLGFFVRGDV